jgi:hypothetical protein
MRADSLIGSGGDEWFFGYAGDDTIDGGGGFDEIRYNNEAQLGATHGITLNFATGQVVDGFGNADTISNIEAVRASMFADTLTGNDSGNRFRALAGDDTIDGSGGVDLVDYRRDTNQGGNAGIDANLATGIIIDGFGDTDTVTNVENVIGTWTSDVIKGDGEFNWLRGEGGNDSITGGGGDDDVYGGDGFDTAVYSGKLSDYLITLNPAGYIEIQDKRAGGDGYDFVFDVEQFVFADSTLQASMGCPSPRRSWPRTAAPAPSSVACRVPIRTAKRCRSRWSTTPVDDLPSAGLTSLSRTEPCSTSSKGLRTR